MNSWNRISKEEAFKVEGGTILPWPSPFLWFVRQLICALRRRPCWGPWV